MKTLAISIFLGAAYCLTAAASDDLRYASEEELNRELESRQGDVARTRERLDELIAKASQAEQELSQAKQDGAVAEKLAVERARTLYKVSRQGGSVRYLAKATSAVDFLARLATLKRLMVDSLEARRQAGLRLAEAQKRLALLREEGAAARDMHRMLEEALAELEREKARRSGPGAPNVAYLKPSLLP